MSAIQEYYNRYGHNGVIDIDMIWRERQAANDSRNAQAFINNLPRGHKDGQLRHTQNTQR